MFNAERVPGTPELEAEQEANKEWFREIAKDYIPYGARKNGCKQCDEGEDHLDHATEVELEASKAAYKKLRPARA